MSHVLSVSISSGLHRWCAVQCVPLPTNCDSLLLPCRLIKNGLPTLFVRQVMQAASFLGCGLSVIPLALSPNPGLVPAVLCLTANLTFYSLSYGGFHAYLQDVCGPYAGVLQGVTNSASILMGMCGSVLTGVVVDASGSYSALFWLLFVMYSTAAVVWCLFTSSHSLQSTRRSVSF